MSGPRRRPTKEDELYKNLEREVKKHNKAQKFNQDLEDITGPKAPTGADADKDFPKQKRSFFRRS